MIHNYDEPWPESGPLRIEVRFADHISVPPVEARRRAAGFLGMNVTMMVLAGEPALVLNDQPVWRVPASLHLPGLGEVATIGSIEVDARTGQVIPPSSEQIADMQRRANAIAARLSLPATSAG